MLNQRYEYDPRKRFVFLRMPLDSTLHCRIETSAGFLSPEFPCRCIRSSDHFSITLLGVDNSGCLQSKNLGNSNFRFKYRLDDSTTGEIPATEWVLIPLNNTVNFSFSYGTEDECTAGVGGNYGVKLVYTFDKTRKEIETTWISPPWRITVETEPIKNIVSGFIDRAKSLLLLD